MPEQKPLIVEAPRQGIAPSSHIGFGDVRNLDIFTIPGIVRLNNNLSKVSGSNVTGLIKWIVRDPVTPANIYAVDDSGEVYISTNSGGSFAVLGNQPTDGGKGQGLTIWKDYLWCPRATAMDLYGPLSGSPSWRNSWAGLTMTSDVLWHPMKPSKINDKLFIGSANYIDSVLEIVGQTFAWDDSNTYTATAQHLTLPANYRVKSLEELGNNLEIGTWKGTTITDFKVADIFPWDMSSSTYGQPIMLNENGVNAMLTLGNYLYILAGVDGKVYKSDGVGVTIIGQIPNSIANIEGSKYLEPFPGSFVNFKGRPTFGVNSGGATYTAGMGIYSLLETSSGSILNLEHTISTGNDGTSQILKIGALLPTARDTILAGWADGSAEGIDQTTTTTRVASYAGYFISPLYQVGDYLNGRTFTKMEFTLAKELVTTEGIQIEWRINLTDDFITLGTYTITNIGTGKTSFREENINIPKCEQIQIKVGLAPGTSSLTTPQFKKLILE